MQSVFQDSNSSGGVLRSETYLTTNYEPEEPVGRDSEIQRIVDAVQPLTHRKSPENLLVYGPAGVGKTTCVKHVFDRLEEETRAKSVYINAWQYNTRPSLLTELLIQLGYPAPRKGKPVDELLSKLREWLDKNRGVAVAIDEFDQLQEKTEIIYDLQMLNEEAENPLGIVMVSNQPPSKVHLDPRSQSRLNCQTLQFNSYNAPQLQEILKKRVKQAFKPGTVPDEVLEAIAEQVAENSGDCRVALEKLLRAGRKADKKGLSEVSLDHIRAEP
ncbi:Cdc6/Cdc18 family protein [Haloarcula argentinensis]|uniref:Cdc6/Cdc18 family protein n=1 Tax=Haloarcula argentinensis TaxID=43776 RepID=UPI0019825A4F|nr:AAA family ATPase [Haloarcula argentinensis]